MNRFARWMVKHRVIVVIICLALMIPSIFGMAATGSNMTFCIICQRIWIPSRDKTS